MSFWPFTTRAVNIDTFRTERYLTCKTVVALLYRTKPPLSASGHSTNSKPWMSFRAQPVCVMRLAAIFPTYYIDLIYN